MPLQEPRNGNVLEFHCFPRVSYEVTLGDPEKIIWSSIKHLCASGYSESILYDVHGIKNKQLRLSIARNLKLYIMQAFYFYEGGKVCQANTAPLFYYYCFLNLAKAICEIQNHNFYKKPESYRHGISWKPSPKYYVHIPTEVISLSARGVWQILWEIISGQHNIRIPHIKLPIKELFALCPEISTEYERIFGEKVSRIDVIEPVLLYDDTSKEVWIRFSVNREKLRGLKISRQKFIQLIKTNDITYRQVNNLNKDLWTFEFENPRKYDDNYDGPLLAILKPEISKLNLSSVLDLGKLQYYIQVPKRITMPLPQIMVLYSLIFWLSSLVRYDPHSVFELQDSEYWILIDGFMNQSGIWLLELFEWELYQAETILRIGR
jgi:hypothetical protein